MAERFGVKPFPVSNTESGDLTRTGETLTSGFR